MVLSFSAVLAAHAETKTREDMKGMKAVFEAALPISASSTHDTAGDKYAGLTEIKVGTHCRLLAHVSDAGKSLTGEYQVDSAGLDDEEDNAIFLLEMSNKEGQKASIFCSGTSQYLGSLTAEEIQSDLQSWVQFK